MERPRKIIGDKNTAGGNFLSSLPGKSMILSEETETEILS